MDQSSRRLRVSGWKAWACGAAVVGLALAAAPAGAAKPTAPGAPTGVSATAGLRSAKVSFSKPTADGGSKITGYRVKCTSSDGGKAASHNGKKSPILVAGLTPAKTYTCIVKARNNVGFGPASDPSNAIVIQKALVPGAPTNVSATAGVRRVKVTFANPSDNGGSRVLNYRAKCTSSNGGSSASHEASKSPIFVAGLTGGKTYTCTVRARNKVGFGPASDPSNAVVTTSH
jgi:Fibronectin type III domain